MNTLEEQIEIIEAYASNISTFESGGVLEFRQALLAVCDAARCTLGTVEQLKQRECPDPVTGMTAYDWQHLEQWLKDGCPKTADTAFTAGVKRDLARLIEVVKITRDDNDNPWKETVRDLYEAAILFGDRLTIDFIEGRHPDYFTSSDEVTK